MDSLYLTSYRVKAKRAYFLLQSYEVTKLFKNYELRKFWLELDSVEDEGILLINNGVLFNL